MEIDEHMEHTCSDPLPQQKCSSLVQRGASISQTRPELAEADDREDAAPAPAAAREEAPRESSASATAMPAAEGAPEAARASNQTPGGSRVVRKEKRGQNQTGPVPDLMLMQAAVGAHVPLQFQIGSTAYLIRSRSAMGAVLCLLGIAAAVGFAFFVANRLLRDEKQGGSANSASDRQRVRAPGRQPAPRSAPPSHSSPQQQQPTTGSPGSVGSPLLGSRQAAAASSVPHAARGGRQPQQLPPQPAFPPGGLPLQGTLCPELIVPEGGECTLQVPWLPTSSGDGKVRVAIDNARGVPVFQAAYLLGQGPDRRRSLLSPRDHEQQRLTLLSASGEVVFAFCRDSTGPRSLTLHRHTEELFGTLVGQSDQLGGAYILRCGRDTEIRFSGHQRLQAIDNHSRLLAMAEPLSDKPQCRSVRIGPKVDAGLIVLCVLGINCLEQQTRDAVAPPA